MTKIVNRALVTGTTIATVLTGLSASAAYIDSTTNSSIAWQSLSSQRQVWSNATRPGSQAQISTNISENSLILVKTSKRMSIIIKSAGKAELLPLDPTDRLVED